jgi:transcriptional regulator with XRE-family HTH domain
VNHQGKLVALGLRIRRLREARHWSQQELADECDLSKKTIQRIELARQNTTLETIIVLAETFRIPLKELVDF